MSPGEARGPAVDFARRAEEDAALQLRHLRFPADLEAAFRADHHLGGLPFVRGLASFLAVTCLAALAREATVHEFGGHGYLVWAIRFVLFAAMAGATLRPPFFQRHAQTVVGGLLIGTTLASVVPGLLGDVGHLRDPSTYFKIVAFSNVEVVAYYTMFRLRLVPASAVAWTSITIHLAAQAGLGHLPAEQVGFAGLLYLNANMVGMFAGWFAERSARRDFLLRRALERERRRSEDLLESILPGSVAQRLKSGEATIADSFAEVTVLFADVVDFTTWAAARRPEEVVTRLNDVFTEFDHLAERHGLEKIKTIGDAYMVVGGLPQPRADHAQAVARLALEMRETLARLSAQSAQPLRMRFGINSGPVVAGVIGRRRFLYDLWGDTVNLASRMEAHGEADAIQVTPETRALLEGEFLLEPAPAVEVKGRGVMTPYRLLRARRA